MDINARVERQFLVSFGGITNSEIIKICLGLLVQVKNYYEAIEAFRGDSFFCCALGITTVSSCSTLRQHMDAHAHD